VKRAHAGPVVAWVTVLAASTWPLVDVGHSPVSVLLVGAYWGWSVLLPGVVLHRLAFPGSSRMAEVGVGGVIGLGLELALRPVSVALEEPFLLWLTPLLLLPLLGLPGARARLSRRSTATDHRLAGLTALVSLLSVAVLWSRYLRRWPLPDQAGSWYQDLMFHLAITRNLQAEIWPSDPQVAGMSLNYHWFANSHIASVSLATGVEASDVALHLWLVPMVVLAVLLLSALAVSISEGWWLGPLVAGLVFIGGSALMVDARLPVGVETAVQPLSPSQMVATPVFLALLVVVVRLLRGSVPRLGGWVVFLGITALGAGVKPTVLPMVGAGFVMVLLWRGAVAKRVDRAAAVMLAAVAGVFAATNSFLAGSTGGSSLAPFALIRGWEVYGELTGDTSSPGADGGWLDAFSTLPGTAVVASLVLGFIAIHVLRWIGLFALFRPSVGADPAIPLLVGTAAAGWAGLLLLDHPGQSQYYFLYTGLPVMVLLTLWLAREVVASGTTWWVGPAAVGLLGGLIAVVAREARLVADAALWLWVVGVVGAVAFGAVLVTRLPSHQTARAPAAAVVGILSASLLLWFPSTVQQHQAVGRTLAEPSARGHITTAEIEAARWLDAAASPHDVVVTNVHCLRAGAARCDARGFWVAALSGRRVLLGGWAYTQESLSNRSGRPYAQAPSPWPGRLAMSQAAVQRPQPGLLSDLAERGVRWVYADRNHSPVSPRLADLADLRFENAEVQIFELRPGRA
jgi:hypothetical protein